MEEQEGCIYGGIQGDGEGCGSGVGDGDGGIEEGGRELEIRW